MSVALPPSHSAVVVRPLIFTTPEEREKILEDVEYNIFAFPAGLLTCDFLSDSGTSAMTDVQWAACESSSLSSTFFMNTPDFLNVLRLR